MINANSTGDINEELPVLRSESGSLYDSEDNGPDEVRNDLLQLPEPEFCPTAINQAPSVEARNMREAEAKYAAEAQTPAVRSISPVKVVVHLSLNIVRAFKDSLHEFFWAHDNDMLLPIFQYFDTKKEGILCPEEIFGVLT